MGGEQTIKTRKWRERGQFWDLLKGAKQMYWWVWGVGGVGVHKQRRKHHKGYECSVTRAEDSAEKNKKKDKQA